MPKLLEAVTLKVTRHEYAALRWMARKLELKRYAGRKPSAAAVLRTMSLDEVVGRYDLEREKAQNPEQPTT